MGATRSQNQTKSKLIERVKLLYPAYSFTSDSAFAWNPTTSTISYSVAGHGFDKFSYSLLHEIGHAELAHNIFTSDLDLLRLERAAWEKAREVASTFSITISDEHIEKCMDTYRDWLYARSLCPNCHQCGLQTSATSYSCIFCHNSWKVSASRLCKVSRRKIN